MAARPPRHVFWRGASNQEAAVIEIGKARNSRRGDTALKRKMPMRFSLVAAVLPALFVCNAAIAQVEGEFDGTVTPTPTMCATSPLGIAAGSPTGIPLGATEITSPGVSPVPTGVTGTITIPTTSSSTACPTVATSPSEMFGSTASFDGGGMSVGTAAPATAANSGATATSGTTAMSGTTTTSATSTSSATSLTSEMPVTSGSSGVIDTSGMSGMCGAASTSIAASSSPTSTSPTTPGGGARPGIPFGFFGIGNLGVGSTPPVPVPNVLPIVGSVGASSSAPTMPTLLPTTSPTTTSTNPACATTGGAATTRNSFAGAGNAGVTGTSIGERTLRQFILCQRP